MYDGWMVLDGELGWMEGVGCGGGMNRGCLMGR